MNILESEINRRIETADSLWVELNLGKRSVSEAGEYSEFPVLKGMALISTTTGVKNVEEYRKKLHELLDREIDKMKHHIEKIEQKSE